MAWTWLQQWSPPVPLAHFFMEDELTKHWSAKGSPIEVWLKYSSLTEARPVLQRLAAQINRVSIGGEQQSLNTLGTLDDDRVQQMSALVASPNVEVWLQFHSLEEAASQFKDLFFSNLAKVEIAKVDLVPGVAQHWGVGITRGGEPTKFFEVTGTGTDTKKTAIAVPKDVKREQISIVVADDDSNADATLRRVYTTHDRMLARGVAFDQGYSMVLSPEIQDTPQFVKAFLNRSNIMLADGSIKRPEDLGASRAYNDYDKHFIVGRTAKTDEDILRWCEQYVQWFPNYELTTCNCQHFALDLCEELTGKDKDQIVAKVGKPDGEWWLTAAAAVFATATAVSGAAAATTRSRRGTRQDRSRSPRRHPGS